MQTSPLHAAFPDAPTFAGPRRTDGRRHAHRSLGEALLWAATARGLHEEDDMPRTIWKGTLSTGGRMAEPFEAEIVRTDDGTPHIIRIEGLSRIEMSPAQIRGDAWLPIVADLAEKLGAP